MKPNRFDIYIFLNYLTLFFQFFLVFWIIWDILWSIWILSQKTFFHIFPTLVGGRRAGDQGVLCWSCFRSSHVSYQSWPAISGIHGEYCCVFEWNLHTYKVSILSVQLPAIIIKSDVGWYSVTFIISAILAEGSSELSRSKFVCCHNLL